NRRKAAYTRTPRGEAQNPGGKNGLSPSQERRGRAALLKPAGKRITAGWERAALPIEWICPRCAHLRIRLAKPPGQRRTRGEIHLTSGRGAQHIHSVSMKLFGLPQVRHSR